MLYAPFEIYLPYISSLQGNIYSTLVNICIPKQEDGRLIKSAHPPMRIARQFDIVGNIPAPIDMDEYWDKQTPVRVIEQQQR